MQSVSVLKKSTVGDGDVGELISNHAHADTVQNEAVQICPLIVTCELRCIENGANTKEHYRAMLTRLSAH